MFLTPGDAYERFMGRYSHALAPLLTAFAELVPGMRALDVGCGSGALTAALAALLGPASVAAVDPSAVQVEACVARVPGADVRVASAAALPWADGAFDAVLSQLVMNFLPDAAAGLREMCRVVRPGGCVATCTWDYTDGMRMLRVFWDAALELDPSAPDEGRVMMSANASDLEVLWSAHGLIGVTSAVVEVSVAYRDFDDYWIPFTLGVGPAGTYLASLDLPHREALRAACFRRLGLPTGGISLSARAVAVRGYRAT